MTAVIDAHGLSKHYAQGVQRVAVFAEIDFTLEAGQQVAIVGTSGAGKSTLLHILAGLDHPSAGQLRLMGHDAAQLSETMRCQLRNQSFGFIYQFHHLLPELTALENVAMPLWLRRMPALQASERAENILKAVGLADRLQHMPSELSGGERQRVAVARALVNQPACVLADEPTGNLDRSNAQHVFDLMTCVVPNTHTQPALIVVTHDVELASRLPVQYRLNEGRLWRER